MSTVPRLSLGLPVFNGEDYLAESLDSILAQSFSDFELIISDNASTDSTRHIVEAYAERDPRIRYFRHERNRGSTYNHNFCITSARGELFKWVSDDDLYHPSLLERCVDALEERPDIVLAHAWTAYMDDSGQITDRLDYPLTTDVQDPVKRFVSLLYTQGGDDIYGVIRMSVLQKVRPFGSYHLADRTFVIELALHGPFFNVPEFYYFRRDHPGRTSRSGGSIRPRCVRLDPRRANIWRHPVARLVGEYLLGFVVAVHRSPISPRDRRSCYRELMLWIIAHANPKHRLELLRSPDPAFRAIGTNSLAARVERAIKSIRNRLAHRGPQTRKTP